jgi:hypothetical protein
MSKNPDSDPGSGSGMNIPDHISESLETIFWVKTLELFDEDPDPGTRVCLTLDPGWKNSDPDPQHCLRVRYFLYFVNP